MLNIFHIARTFYDHKKFIALAREVKKVKDGIKTLVKSAVPVPGGVGGSDKADKSDLRSLAVQVTNLENAIRNLQPGKPGKPGGATPGAGSGQSVVQIINSPEFKQTFDTKINQVLNYIKSEVVPKAVKKAMDS